MWADRFTNNILSTAQQVWLRKMGGAKPLVSENASGIISAGKAKRSASQSAQSGDRFRQLKEEETRRQASKAVSDEDFQMLASTSESDSDVSLSNESKETGELEEALASSGSKQVPKDSSPKKSKRSKRKRVG